MKRKSLLMCTVAVLLAVATPRSSFAGDEGNNEGEKIVGAWVVSITGGPGTPPLPNWYRALATFTSDGGLIETITDPLIGTGHGRWIKTRNREFALTTLLFRFDATGDFLGTLKARGNATVDKSGEQFSSDRYLFEFFDRDGVLVTSGVGTARGMRIVVQPLP